MLSTNKLCAAAHKIKSILSSLQSINAAAVDCSRGNLSATFLSRPDILHNYQSIRHYGYPYYPDWVMLRDQKRRKLMEKHWGERIRLNALRKTDSLPTELGEAATTDLLTLPRDSNYTRIFNRCFVSSRARACFHQWRMARMVFRCEADYNRLSGTSRADWFNRNDKRYNEHLQPDLKGTLNAIQPITYEVHQQLYSRQYYGKFKPPPRYNQNIFKTKSFEYPPKREGDRVPAIYTHINTRPRAREHQVRREQWLMIHGMGGKPKIRVRTSLSWRPRPNLWYKKESLTLATIDRKPVLDVSMPASGQPPW